MFFDNNKLSIIKTYNNSKAKKNFYYLINKKHYNVYNLLIFNSKKTYYVRRIINYFFYLNQIFLSRQWLKYSRLTEDYNNIPKIKNYKLVLHKALLSYKWKINTKII